MQALDPGLREDVDEDLAHLFESRRAKSGRLLSWLWYWRQVLWALARIRRREPSQTRKLAGGFFGPLPTDLWHAWRALWKERAFSLAVVLTLGIGIGANTAMYSVMHAVMFSPLPYPEPDQLAMLWSQHAGADRGNLSGPGFEDILLGTDAFQELVQIKGIVDDVALFPEGAYAVQRRSVSENLFRAYGIAPILGRDFRPGDRELLPPEMIQDPAAVWPTRPVVISFDFWQARFGGATTVLGRTIRIGARSWEVIGVMPKGFVTYLPPEVGTGEVDLWYLSPWDERLFGRDVRFVATLGRLRDGVSLEEAQRQLDVVAGRIRAEDPEMAEAELRFIVDPLRSQVVADVAQLLTLLFLAVGSVLLVACTNVSNLLLTRSTVKRRETAVRAALGAGRRRIISHSLVEIGILAGVGALVGLILGAWLLDGLVALAPATIPRLVDVSLNLPVMLFAAGITLCAAMAAGVLPALRAASTAPYEVLRGERMGGFEGRGVNRWRNSFVVVQLTVSIVLVAITALLARSFMELRRVDLGWNEQHLLTGQFLVPGDAYPSFDDKIGFLRSLHQRIGQIPGVRSLSVMNSLPLQELDELDVRVDTQREFRASFRLATPGFIGTLGGALVDGRDLNWTDITRRDAFPAMIDEAFAERAWPGETPLGKTFEIDALTVDGQSAVWSGIDRAEVVGVFRSMRTRSPAVDDRPTFIASFQMWEFGTDHVAVRVDDNGGAQFESIRQALRDVNRSIAVSDLQSARDRLSAEIAPVRFVTFLMGSFGFVSALLAGIGLYAVMSFSVAQRRAEFGLRQALGATPENIGRLVIKKALALLSVGLAFGTLVAIGGVRLIESRLYGVESDDPGSLLLVALVFTAVSAFATLTPVRRAIKSDPAESLRSD